MAADSPKNLKIINDSDDEVLIEDSPKKSKKFVDTDFDDGAGSSKSNLTDSGDSKKYKKPKSLKKPLKPTGSSKDLVDL